MAAPPSGAEAGAEPPTTVDTVPGTIAAYAPAEDTDGCVEPPLV